MLTTQELFHARTWPVSRVLDGGSAGYSDRAILPTGEVLWLYEGGMLEHMGDIQCLKLARFGVECMARSLTLYG